MRFEIRTGGALLILIGLLGLSGAVFALGLVAGYEMARQNTPDTSQIASVFPVPSPPAIEPTATASPAAAASASPAAVAAATAGNLAKSALGSTAPLAAKTPAAVAARTTPSVKPAPREAEPAEEEGASAPAPRAAASVAALAPPAAIEAKKKGYNIQIEAVMDKTGADDMIRKLKALGYSSYEVGTNISGQTWYRVRVGPYATPEEARAAQAKLKEQYKAAYMSH